MRHELMSSGCSVATEIEDGRIYVIRGDINNLVQVLNNLLYNAIYAQKQGGGGTITIGVKKDEEVLKIFVRDTGPGISARVRERLFKEMVTSKGIYGTCLLYTSRRFGQGRRIWLMWYIPPEAPGSLRAWKSPSAACLTL